MNVAGFAIARPRRSFVTSGRRFTARHAIPLVGVPLVGVLATASFAAWASTAAGTASAKSTTDVALTTSAVVFTTGKLYPGSTGEARITINNPNPYAVTITQIADAHSVTQTNALGQCATTGVTFATQTGSFVVPAKSGALDGTATFTFATGAAMSAASDSGCQNATFAIAVTLTGTSS